MAAGSAAGAELLKDRQERSCSGRTYSLLTLALITLSMQTFKTPLTEINTCSSQGDFGHQNCAVRRGGE